MTYQEAKNIITKKQSLGIKPGLTRIFKLLESMGNPQNDLKIIHIAGTNGKGTVAAIISNELMKSGKRVGTFSSPWIIDYREQIQINGEFIPEQVFADYVEKWHNNDCTEFELLTAIMYKYFADYGVDYAVVECGMGGKGDSTNVENENISVITSVSLDHTDFLGDTVEKIAEEKSGILRKNCTCVLYPNTNLSDIFAPKCKKLVCVKEQGDFKHNNLATAQAVLDELGIDCTAEYASLPARQEKIHGVLLDGAHNREGGKGLAPILSDEVALIGMMRDKDVDGYLSYVAPRCKKIIAVTPANPRSMPAAELANIAKKYCTDVIFADDLLSGLRVAKDSGLTLVCGSFYLVRDVRNLI